MTIEEAFHANKVMALNIHKDADGWRVHWRKADEGFRCAQQSHATLQAALDEHFEDDLLV